MRRYPHVLIVDDSRAFRIFCRDIIKNYIKNVRIFEAEDGIRALKLYLQYKPDLILLDLKMPKLNGSKVLEVIKKHDVNVKIIVTTAYDLDKELTDQLLKFGACNFVPKYLNRELLMKSISDVLYKVKMAGIKN